MTFVSIAVDPHVRGRAYIAPAERREFFSPPVEREGRPDMFDEDGGRRLWSLPEGSNGVKYFQYQRVGLAE